MLTGDLKMKVFTNRQSLFERTFETCKRYLHGRDVSVTTGKQIGPKKFLLILLQIQLLNRFLKPLFLNSRFIFPSIFLITIALFPFTYLFHLRFLYFYQIYLCYLAFSINTVYQKSQCETSSYYL